MQKKWYSSPEIELVELQIIDPVLVSMNVPTIVEPTDEYGTPIYGKRPSMKDELEGDNLFESAD